MATSLKTHCELDHFNAYSKDPQEKKYQVNGKLMNKSPSQNSVKQQGLQKRSYIDANRESRSPCAKKIKTEKCSAETEESCMQIQHSPDSGLTDVHLCDLNAEGSAPASDKKLQTKFLRLMGWQISTSIPDSDSQSLGDKEVNILAAANQHMFISSLKEKSNEKVKNDGYYTHQTMNDTIKKAFETQNAPMCTCKAHKALSETSSTDQAKKYYRELIRLPQEVNDDTGKRLAVALIEQIFDHLKIKDKTVTPMEMGTSWDVDFVLLDNKTSDKVGFRGWGDFCICHQEMNAGAEELLISVGEVESKDTDTIAKLGIYSVGQFRKKMGVPKRYLPSVGIYKDKAAIICIAERIPPNESSAEDLGRVTFKLVEGANRLDLKSTKGVQDFARKLTATINFALKNN